MQSQLPYSRPLFWILLAFAATAVASISLQNLIWVAVLLFFFACFKNKQKVDWPWGPFPIATLLFIASFFISALFGINPFNSFHTVHKYLAMLMIFPLGAMTLTSEQVRKLLLAFLYGAAFCALFGIGKHLFLHEPRIDSFSGDKMVFGGMLMAALLIQILFLKREPKFPWHWVSLVLIATGFTLTQTRGAWVGFVLGFSLLMWRLSRKWLFLGVLALIVAYFLLPPTFQNRIKSITDISFSLNEKHEIDHSSQTRILIWDAGVKIIKDHPWGVGQGNVEKIYPKYRSPYMYFEPTEPHLHNNFLQICAQNGWWGLLIYLSWIFIYFWTALNFKTPNIETERLNWVFLSIFSAVLVWGLTEYTFSHQFMNVQFFLLGLQLNLWNNSERGISP